MGLIIHTRKFWGAAPARPRTKQAASGIREFFVHWPGLEHGSTSHINTVREECEELREEQAFHMGPQRGWADIGYSFAIFQSGRVYRLRGIDYVPAAQLGHNTGTVAVTCILGPDDRPSEALKLSLRRLKDHCDHRTGRDLRARPHSDVTGTTCPGPLLRAFIPALNRS